MDGIKTFFLSFFVNRYTRKAADTRALVWVLGGLLALLFLFSGLMIGFVASYDTHYDCADEFKRFAYAAFAGEDRICIKLEGGVLTADPPYGETVDSFKTGDYAMGGYNLIVDTRPELSQLFDDCTVYCKKGNERVEYEAWLQLSQSDRRSYKLCVDYTGEALDTSIRHDEYKEYLEERSDKENENYNAVVEREFTKLNTAFAEGGLTEAEYQNKIYALWFAAYYPPITDIEENGDAPTVLQYYTNRVKANGQKLLVLTREMGRVFFVNSKGVLVAIEGKYGPGSIVIDAQTAPAQAKRAVDELIKGIFEQKRGSDVGVYAANTFMALPWIIVALLICAAIIRIASAFGSFKFQPAFGKSCKIAASFMFVAGAAAFLAAIIMSFSLSRGEAYTMAILVLAGVMLLRTAAYVITEAVIKKRAKPDLLAEQPAPTDEEYEQEESGAETETQQAQ